MNNSKQDDKWGPKEHFAVGAGVGAAGAGQTLVILGIAAGAPVAGVVIALGGLVGLALWGIKKLDE